MNLFIYGFNHEVADIELREKIAFTTSQKIAFYNYFLDEINTDLVILSTCNRTELIFCSSDLDYSINKINNYYQNQKNISNFDKFNIKKNTQALNYLFESSCGLHSLVIGEDQIQSQIKEAYLTALENYECSKFFNKLFQSVFACSREVRATHNLSEIPLSISYIGINLLKENHQQLKDKNIMIVGLGKMNQLALKYLLDLEVNKITLVNKTMSKCVEIAKQDSRIDYYPFDKRFKIIDDYDVIISATSAPHLIFKEEHLKALNQDKVFLDMALPRDVYPSSRHQIYNIDSLKSIVQQNNQLRLEKASAAKELIQEHINKFIDYYHNQDINKLNNQLLDIHQDIIDKTLDFLNKKIDLDAQQFALLERSIKQLNNKLVTIPLNNLRAMELEEKKNYHKMLEKLYRIGE